MSEERRKEILLGILDLLEEAGSMEIDIDFPDDNYVIHIAGEVKE